MLHRPGFRRRRCRRYWVTVGWLFSREPGGWYPDRRAGQLACLPRSPPPHHWHQPPPGSGPAQPRRWNIVVAR
jgi:hypothetical protein